MKYELAKEGTNIIKMDITIPAKDANHAYDGAVRRFAMYVNIDGFRKGKAPKHLIERQVGNDRIKAEAIENVLPNMIDKIVEEKELDLITQPYITDYKWDDGKDLSVTLRAEERPAVVLGKYKDITVTVEDAAVTEDAFKGAIDGLMARHKTEETVKTKRAASGTDIAVIDFDGYVDGKQIQGGKGENYSLDLGNSNFIKGFAEAIVGHKAGEEFDIDVTFPADYGNAELGGKPAVFKIKLHELKERKEPVLNDEFAKKVGKFKNVAELEADVRGFLEAQRETANKQNSENEMFKVIVDAAKVEIPPAMIERETASIVEEYKARLSQQGITWDAFVKAQNEKEIMQNIRDDAMMRIKNSLVIGEIAKTEKIKIDANDLQHRLADMSAAYGMTPDMLVKQAGGNRDFINNLSQQAMNEKVRDFLMTNNKVVLKAGKAAPAKKEIAAKAEKAEKPASKKATPAKSTKKATTKKAK